MVATRNHTKLATEAEAERARLHHRPRFPGHGLLRIARAYRFSSNRYLEDPMHQAVKPARRDPLINRSLGDVETAVSMACDEARRAEARHGHVDSSPWSMRYRTPGVGFPHATPGAAFPYTPEVASSSWSSWVPPPRRLAFLHKPGEAFAVFRARLNWVRNSWDTRLSLLIPADHPNLPALPPGPLPERHGYRLETINAFFQTPWQRNWAERALVLATKEAQRWLAKHRDARVQEVAEFVPIDDVAKIVCGYLAPAAHVRARVAE